MKLSSKPNAISSVVVVAMAVVLILLAVLQYHWSFQVSEAAGARMKAALEASMMRFRLDLHRELGAIGAAFPEDGPVVRDRLARYAQQYASWSRTAAHPGLVADMFVARNAADEHPLLLRLDRVSGRFQPVAWPSDFARLQARLAASTADIMAMVARFRPTADDRRRPPDADRRGFPGPPWFIDENLPALVHAVLLHPAENPSEVTGIDWLVLPLDRKNLAERTLPDLAERHFSGAEGLEYQVAVVGQQDNLVIYSSDPNFGKQGDVGTDAAFEIFGAPGRGLMLNRQPSGRHLPRIEPLRYAGQDKDWLLMVKHRKGSLDAVVTGLRRRDLGLSFGVLLVLAATMGMIIIASQRAHRLAKLQMDFVTGVSHELRTPLAVISSAAENLADGVVDNPEQMTRYGKVIKKQSAQLARLVEQILMFAALRKGRLQYNVRPLAAPEIVAAALNDAAETIRNAGFTVERAIEPNLPLVMGDLPALSQCLQNLITNAVKYGGADRWIGVRATRAEQNGHDPEVRISVADHGEGISHAELQRIFEPFYRSPAVAAAQIHGSGLGLPLARSIAEAMGGRLTAISEPGKGSSFTLHLRSAGAAVLLEMGAAAAPSA